MEEVKSYQGPLYTPYDDNGKRREDLHSTKLTKNQIAYLCHDLYGAYLKLYFENKELKKEIEKIKNIEQEPEMDDSDMFEEYINKLIDKRVKEKLYFDESSQAYSGSYAKLTYDGRELGSVCLESYYDE